MIISSTDEIPNRRIISVVGEISTKAAHGYKKGTDWKAKQNLISKATSMGADAIINFSWHYSGFLDLMVIYTGVAVITGSPIPVQQALNTDVCWSCGKPIKEDYRFCVFCGKKQVLFPRSK